MKKKIYFKRILFLLKLNEKFKYKIFQFSIKYVYSQSFFLLFIAKLDAMHSDATSSANADISNYPKSVKTEIDYYIALVRKQLTRFWNRANTSGRWSHTFGLGSGNAKAMTARSGAPLSSSAGQNRELDGILAAWPRADTPERVKKRASVYASDTSHEASRWPNLGCCWRWSF